MKFIVHIGAHKTATTFIQNRLRANEAELAEAGLKTPVLKTFRKDFTPYFMVGSIAGPLFAFFWKPFLRHRLSRVIKADADTRAIILTDENLMGLLNSNYRRGSLYPYAARRIALLDKVLDNGERHYYFSIRNYAEFLPSAYLQLAARARSIDFGEFLTRFSPDMRGWREVVSDLVRTVGPDRVTVWSYEWFKSHKEDVFSMVAPGARFTLTPEDDEVRILPSVTVKGLAVMQALDSVLTKDEKIRMAKFLRRFKFEPPDSKLAITDRQAIEAWNKRYLEDRQAIRALGVTFHDLPLPAEN